MKEKYYIKRKLVKYNYKQGKDEICIKVKW